MTGVASTNHCDALSHIIHAISGIRPRFDNNGGTSRQIKSLDLSLHLFVGQTGSLNGLHVLRINVGVLSLDMLLLDDFVLVKVDNKLKQLVFTTAAGNHNLNAGIASRDVCDGLLVMLLLKIRNHLLLGGFQQGDDPKVGLLATKVWTDDL